MLKSLVQIASSRWMKGFFIALWSLSLLWMIDRGWVWEMTTSLPGGGVEVRKNYFDIRRSALFVWLTLVLLGYAAHAFKQRHLGYYGLVEVSVGLIGGFLAVSKLSLDSLPAWFSLAASAYVIVRGAGNIGESVKKSEQREQSGI